MTNSIITNINKKYRTQLYLTEASYSDQISSMSRDAMYVFWKPLKFCYNGVRGGRTGWDYIYCFDNSERNNNSKKLRHRIKKLLVQKEEEILKEYFDTEAR